ncbi:MAG: hypothetical protein HP028_04865 [Clostridia bacterium]|nr:hypothetical protein [Clostridia bacterium]
MKCPERYKVIQQNLRQPIFDEDNIVRGEYHLLVETQQFENCYKEKCAAWDSEKNKCRKVGK